MVAFLIGIVIGLVVGWNFLPQPEPVANFVAKVKAKFD